MRGKNKTGPKSPRNKHKMVLYVEGMPDALYYEKEEILYSLIIPGLERIIPLGKCGKDVPEELKNSIPGSKVTQTLKKYKRVLPFPESLRAVGRKIQGNTHITVGAPTKELLDTAVYNTKHFLRKLGVDVDERCEWVCTIDHKYAQPTPMPTPIPIPVFQFTPTTPPGTPRPPITLEFTCSTLSSKLEYPRDCDECVMGDTCAQRKTLLEATGTSP